MPLQDITFRNKSYFQSPLRQRKEDIETIDKSQLGSPRLGIQSIKSVNYQLYESQKSIGEGTNRKLFLSSKESADQSVPSEGCFLASGSNINENGTTPFDDWESTILCQPIKLSGEYLKPSEWDDKRSVCQLCRGVSVQAGSEVRHCRGRAHRTAYALLQTLRFTDVRERSYLQQHCIDKNGQCVTAWKCLLCDTKSLSHEYMNKHLLGKKHRQIANMEFDTEMPPLLQGNLHHQEVVDGFFMDEETGGDFFTDNQQFQHRRDETILGRCDGASPFHRGIESCRSSSSIMTEATEMRNPKDIVRFLGILSPEKPTAPVDPNGRFHDEALMRPIDITSQVLPTKSLNNENDKLLAELFEVAFGPSKGYIESYLPPPQDQTLPTHYPGLAFHHPSWPDTHWQHSNHCEQLHLASHRLEHAS